MSFSRRSLLAAAFITFAALVLLPAAQAQDIVYTVNKKQNRGNIPPDGMTAAEVSIDMAGLAKKFPANEIIKIAFAEDPSELVSARNLTVDKNYNSAKDQLAKLDVAKV